MKKLCFLLIATLLSGCEFLTFTYTAKLTPKWTVEQQNNSVVASEGTSNTLPTIATNPAYNFILEILSKAQVVDAAKIIAVCIAGDPASIQAFNSNAVFKVEVTKKFVFFKTKDKTKDKNAQTD